MEGHFTSKAPGRRKVLGISEGQGACLMIACHLSPQGVPKHYLTTAQGHRAACSADYLQLAPEPPGGHADDSTFLCWGLYGQKAFSEVSSFGYLRLRKHTSSEPFYVPPKKTKITPTEPWLTSLCGRFLVSPWTSNRPKGGLICILLAPK